MRNLRDRKEEVVTTIFASIGKDVDALPALSIESMSHVHDEVGLSISSDDFDTLSEGIYNLGEAIYQQLKDAKAYSNGRLLYQQSSWIGNDLIVQRLDSNVRPDLIIGEPLECEETIPF